MTSVRSWSLCSTQDSWETCPKWDSTVSQGPGKARERGGPAPGSSRRPSEVLLELGLRGQRGGLQADAVGNSTEAEGVACTEPDVLGICAEEGGGHGSGFPGGPGSEPSGSCPSVWEEVRVWTQSVCEDVPSGPRSVQETSAGLCLPQALQAGPSRSPRFPEALGPRWDVLRDSQVPSRPPEVTTGCVPRSGLSGLMRRELEWARGESSATLAPFPWRVTRGNGVGSVTSGCTAPRIRMSQRVDGQRGQHSGPSLPWSLG